ncbi:hypothetical protein PC9H_009478 [Pleurotus ostreatus]|uniref:AB hydrolase-1 domain-containing protein n=1 Tax=Pleurotus ostreatus TaxID=5322 RepID=A0A8H6ZTS9_PLEOS|nr:uncharacterized protein PC9H_009478 [Pleurotus ostreatus]KAF7424175.1 hypothetical protein PC9H_009478 [Pleurotus ostreatus]KAJ8692969.1 hypothetical protein PTI98_010228 [Pleurotus ostreatus]
MASTLAINAKGTEFAYIDSGPPKTQTYVTIFALHGFGFSSHVFSKVSDAFRAKGGRFVAITRRGYRGSTPFAADELAVLAEGDEAQKTVWLKDRAVEIASFIDSFIQQQKLPAPSSDGKQGGIAILGWSGGNSFTAAVISSIDSYAEPVQIRLSQYLRAHIMLDPPSLSFGLPFPPKTYTPLADMSIPADKRGLSFVAWITSYFQHGDLSTRNLDVIEYVVPAFSHTPSIWNMTLSDISEMVDEPGLNVDMGLLGFIATNGASYKSATFDKSIKSRFTHLQFWLLIGDLTSSFGLAALWSIQDDDKANGGDNVHYKVISGANHFMHWDEPERTADVLLETLS